MKKPVEQRTHKKSAVSMHVFTHPFRAARRKSAFDRISERIENVKTEWAKHSPEYKKLVKLESYRDRLASEQTNLAKKLGLTLSKGA